MTPGHTEKYHVYSWGSLDGEGGGLWKQGWGVEGEALTQVTLGGKKMFSSALLGSLSMSEN